MKLNKKNLAVIGNKVWSYTTCVATIEGDKLLSHGYYSKTTTKHINYVAEQLNLKIVK